MRTPLLFLLAGLLGAGCVVLDDPDWMDDDDDDAGDDDDSTDAQEPCTDPDDPENWLNEVPDSYAVAAAFLKPDGSPVQNLMITLCGGACYNEPTNCDGIVYFPLAATDTYVLEPLFAIDQEFDKWARSFDFVDYTEGQGELDLTATPFTVPLVEDIEPIGTGAVERTFPSGLTVSFDADNVSLPFGPNEGTLGVVEIPSDRFPVGGLMGWTPLRAWALAVWEMQIGTPEGFQVSAELNEAVPAGNEITWLVAHYDFGIEEGHFEVFPAELNGDRTIISTPADAGIDRTTMWIAATRPEQTDGR